MNSAYYAARLTSFRIYNKSYEIILAIGTSSAIAGWPFFQEWTVGKKIWAVFSALVTVLAVLKPILQLPRQIERYSKLHVGYTDLYYDLKKIVSEIEESRDITSERLVIREAAQKRFKDLALQDDTKPSARLLRKCFEKVKVAILVERLWYPEPCRSKPSRHRRRKKDETS